MPWDLTRMGLMASDHDPMAQADRFDRARQDDVSQGRAVSFPCQSLGDLFIVVARRSELQNLRFHFLGVR